MTGSAICSVVYNIGMMGAVMRGTLTLVVILTVTGGVMPSVAVSDPVPPSDRSVLSSQATAAGQGQASGAPSVPPPAGSVVPDEEPTSPTLGGVTGPRDHTLFLTQRFERVPDRPGVVQVQLVYTVPDQIVSLQTSVPADAVVTGRDGFTRHNATRFEWTGRTQRPTVTYHLSVNETVNRTDPQVTDSRLLYADTRNWSLFERPSTETHWRRTGRSAVQYNRRTATVGPGAVGEWIVYLGEHEVHQRQAHGQAFRLVVPEAAAMNESSTAVLDALAASSDALRVGDRDDSVFAVAAPTEGVSWGVRGLQTGDSDMWVGADEQLDEPDNAWVHEYVHSRQSFTLTDRTLWFEEASASYYAAFLALEQDSIEFDAFSRRMQTGATPDYNRTVLTSVSTWKEYSDYHRGALTAGQLDRQLRTTTDRERTLQDVFRAMNDERRPVTQSDFLYALSEAGGPELRTTGQRYTESRSPLAMWNRTTHATVFGQLPARVGYTVPPVSGGDAYRIAGPYRTGTVDGREPISLVTNEQLTVSTVVKNSGGTAGQYNLSFRVNGTTVNETSGEIGAARSKTVPLSHRFPTPGRYQVTVDGRTVNVTVRRPASARVVGLAVDRSRVQQGESVSLTATVENGATVPGEVTVVFTRNFEALNRTRVTLPANNTTAVTEQIGLPEAGHVSVGAGGAPPIEVAVSPVESLPTATSEGDPPQTATPTDRPTTRQPPATATTSADGPGPDVVVLGLALLLVALGTVLHRRT